MDNVRRLLTRGLALGAATISAEGLWALLRPVPTLPEFDASGVEGPPAGIPLHLVAVGDSTLTGPGVSDPGEIWIRQLARRIPGHRVTVTSLAVGGARTRDVIRHQLDAAVDARGDIAFVSVGGNDIWLGTPLRALEEQLEHIVARLARVSPIVVLSGIGDVSTIPRLLPPLDRILRRRGRSVDAVHARVAQRHGVVKCDMWGLTTHAFRHDPALFSPDLLHPSPEGHVVWAEAALVTIAPHLSLDGSS